ncbi:hypothetical protein HELRODRAFT_159354 [Helobdella robusta]|uniref:Thyrotropin-releasing hormone receptor n=1 Tax=Helobdella robusta TaxID=6412 RepID=T1ENX5_HELRO|nr:hypothetical protein HELRODRAFT_159354 [Helobdella robusta]ESO12770.1 hypothetical protein HELRODRAFT_159354 [Helobdella robusta]
MVDNYENDLTKFIAIIFPLKAHMICSRKRIFPVIFIVWFFSFLSSSPIIIYNVLTPPMPPSFVSRCQIIIPGQYGMALYKLLEMIIFFFFPVFLQIFLYGIVAKKLYTSSMALHKTPRIIINPDQRNPSFSLLNKATTSFTMATLPNANSADSKHRLSAFELAKAPSVGSLSTSSNCNFSTTFGKKKKIPETIKSRKEVIKMLVASVLIYFFSYLPQQVLSLHKMATGNDLKVSWSYFVFAMTLSYVNSASNPVLYAIFSQKFRSKFKLLLTCRKGVTTSNNCVTNIHSINTTISRRSTSAGLPNVASNTMGSNMTLDKNYFANAHYGQSVSTAQ